MLDAEADRRHPVKCHRPIASGAVSIKQEMCIRDRGWTVGLMAICIVIQLLLGFDNPESEVMNRYRYNFMGGM